MGELDDGVLGEDPVEIDVEWSSINVKDSMVVQPGNRVVRRSPLVAGVDLAAWHVFAGGCWWTPVVSDPAPPARATVRWRSPGA